MAKKRAADWDARLSPEGDDDFADREDERLETLPLPIVHGSDSTLEERVAMLPVSPGVYLMRDKAGRVIYVGKAANLRSRVRSYFREGGDGRPFLVYLQRQIADVEFVVTHTEKEALLLENTLIKKLRPRYNIRLRDDKTYISLRLDITHEWPRVHRVRRRRVGDKALYFGPYASSSSVKETLRFLQKLFPIRSCPDTVLTNRTRPCLLHQIGRCSAPCVGLADRAQYDAYVEGTKLFLRGKRDEVLTLLRTTMETYAENLEFERAAMVRDRLRALERTVETEKVHSHRVFDRDVVSLNRSRGMMMLTVMYFRRGRLDETRHFDFRDLNAEEGEIIGAFLGQHYAGSRPVPRDILLSTIPADREVLERALADIREGPVRLVVPERGEKRRLIEMALENGREMLDRVLAGERTRGAVLEDLQKALDLPALPRRIECFDISNFQGSFPVGAMTCMIDGEPDKSQYRKFTIKTVVGQDDFAMMHEVVSRRYARATTDSADLPDLIVIDGGKGQLGAACDALEKLGLLGRIPVAGLAKARVLPSSRGTSVVQHSEERVFLPGRKNPVVLNRANPALFLLMRIRDEAHRFGVTFHRHRRGKSAFLTGIEGIPGLGPTRRKTLIKHFGSVVRLRAASLDEIAAVPGIPRKVAEELTDFLRRTAPAPPSPPSDTPESE